MKDKINGKNLIASAVFFCLSILMTMPAFALTITNSTTFNVSLNNGAYITQSTAASNLFNQEIFTSGDETKSGTVAFSDIPYFDFGSTLYFQFTYDMQETGGNPATVGGRPLSIDDIVISITGPVNVWDFNQASYGSILLNSVLNSYTDTPLGAGGDMALYVPVSLFYGRGLTGSDLLTLTVTQSQSDNGKDEWVVLGSGSFFGPNDPIDPNIPPQAVVPEPSTVVLLGSGLLGLIYVGRSRRRK